MFKFFDFLRGGPHRSEARVRHPQRKYAAFKRLLSANNRALEMISELEEIFYQDRPFTLGDVLMRIELLLGDVYSIVEDLNALSGARFPALFDAFERIGAQVLNVLEKKRRIDPTALVIAFERISQDDAAEVGGKAANLGEIMNRAHLPVPPGFAVSAYACQLFLESNELSEFIDGKLRHLNVDDTEALMAASAEIQSRINQARIPEALESEMLRHAARLSLSAEGGGRFSVRSSATSEDSEASFAGQHSTVLNVGPEGIYDAYREVVGSTFNPRAIFYRRRKGYRDQDVLMSVACVAMIDARASGVLYTVDPNDSRHRVIMISAVWGLAVDAVGGAASTDFFQIEKSTGGVERSEIADKAARVRPRRGQGIVEEPVPDELRRRSCLGENDIRQLVDAAERLENHYGYALDIEWAFGRDRRLFILQARPLRRSARFGAEALEDPRSETPYIAAQDHPVLLKGGASACDGVAAGRAYRIESDHMLHHVPKGTIIVARQTSPRYVPLMGRIRGIVTDVGSVTGHMASVAREFQIPTLVGTGTATKDLADGEEITLDATHRTVYRGFVSSLAKKKRPVNPMKGSPTYKAFQAALKRIAPLNLIDPHKESFKPETCETLHDVIRFAHEMSMQEMFNLGDDLGPEKRIAVPLKIRLPLNLYLVDLGGGLSEDVRDSAEHNQIRSVPLLAVIQGMSHPDVDWSRDVGVHWGGFGSILAESILRDPGVEGRMGGPNYAVVSKHYMNLSSRLGYHFTTIDTYCGPKINDNYITFHFKGGAADIGRRTRRAQLIAGILKQLGFKVEQKGDMIRGELKKYEKSDTSAKLDRLGRLLGSVRLLDMVLSDDRQVRWYVEAFMAGNYSFRQD